MVLFIACNLLALSSLANATATAQRSPSVRLNVAQCIISTRADPEQYTVELAGGTKVEIVKTAQGTPTSIRILLPNGEESRVSSRWGRR